MSSKPNIDNRKHRPPHSAYEIRELLKLRKFDAAKAACDANVEFYDQKIGEQQDLFLEVQCASMGLEYNRDNKLAVAANTPKRRMPTSRVFGEKGIGDE